MPNVETDKSSQQTALFQVLAAVAFCHLLNDMMQSLLPAIYPILKGGFDLSFAQIGLLTLVFSGDGFAAAALHRPLYRSQPATLFARRGNALFALGAPYVVAGAELPSFSCSALFSLGAGSSIFHPKSSRIARLASGGRHGAAQSLFQVGGQFGQSLGPLLAAFVVLPNGPRKSGVVYARGFCRNDHPVLFSGDGTKKPATSVRKQGTRRRAAPWRRLKETRFTLSILIALMFSKFFYLASITSYYIFYLMQRFNLPQQKAQIFSFIFLASSAVGLIVSAASLGDQSGRRTSSSGARSLGCCPSPWLCLMCRSVGRSRSAS